MCLGRDLFLGYKWKSQSYKITTTYLCTAFWSYPILGTINKTCWPLGINPARIHLILTSFRAPWSNNTPPSSIAQAKRVKSTPFQGNQELKFYYMTPVTWRLEYIWGLGVQDADLIPVFHKVTLHRKPEALFINQQISVLLVPKYVFLRDNCFERHEVIQVRCIHHNGLGQAAVAPPTGLLCSTNTE